MTMTKKRVLIVEDDYALSDAFNMILKHAGYEPTSVHNGKDAIEYLQQSTTDIIILDILMPVMDGWEFLKTFKNADSIPIIALSNLDAKADIEKVLELGATRYVLKASVSPLTLGELIDETLAGSSVQS